MLSRISRTVAAAVACLLAAVGAVVLAVVSPVALVGVILTGSVAGLIVATHLPGVESPGDLPGPGRTRYRHVAGVGVVAGAAATAALLVMTGIAALLGAAAAPVFLVLLVGAVAATWRHRAGWRAYADAVAYAVAHPAEPGPADVTPTTAAPDTPGGAPRPAAAAPQGDPDAPTVRALCLAWHRSHWSLGRLPEGPARSELVAARTRLLDELEQRDPAGFRRWLHRGIDASSDPSHYLTENRTTATPPTPTAPARRDDDRRPQ